MTRHLRIGRLIAICLLAYAVVGTASSNSIVVTNPTPAVAATMALTRADTGCFTWSVSGKLKPAYRGFNAAVQLVCQSYDQLGQAPAFVFPWCDGPCAT